MFLLGDFRALPPRHRPTQAETFDWLAHAHTRAEMQLAEVESRTFDAGAFLDKMRKRLERFGCDPTKIARRGHEIDDCSHLRWSEMDVYRLADGASGAGMSARTKLFASIATRALERLFCEVIEAPRHLIHVTCTGYLSPSAAQLLVAGKRWGELTCVTHAYHMGCYAALPALRMAAGFAAQSRSDQQSRRVDIVHTEICSLHLNPLRHEPEQLVIQSLFADGCIAYSLAEEADFDRRRGALAVLSQLEWIVPDSADSMAWFCGDFGMEMVLARDVPDKIAGSLAAFVERLRLDAGEAPGALGQALFAIHPGGPKIVDQIAVALGLSEAQIAFSRAVLREHGNMSSATLPHVWQSIVSDSRVPSGQLVVSLAFGPGLTLSGALLRKVAAC